MKKLYTLCLAAILSSVSFAQCPKFAFFEDFTQAGCSPCAAGNIVFHPNVYVPNPIKLRMISIHCSWPGTDPMYTHNPNGNDTRTWYYNVNGIPEMHLNGTRRVTAPQIYTQRDVDDVWNEGSPLKITVNMVDNGNNRDVTITVKSIGTPPSGTFTLYTAITQKDSTFTTAPGQNGEVYFPDIFREMLPGNNGIAITLPTIGNSVTFGPYNFLEDQSFWLNPNKIQALAFIQKNSTKEVIQCGSSYDPILNATMTQSNPNIMNVVANTPQVFNFNTGNSGTSGSEQFNYTLASNAPSGWTSGFTINSVNYVSSASITIPANTSYAANISVTPNSNHGLGKYTLTMQSVTNPTAPPMIETIYVMSGVTDLIVNNANALGDESILGDANNWSSVYTTSLAATGCTTWGNLDDHRQLIKLVQNNQMTGVKNIYYNIGYSYCSLPYWSDSVLIPELTSFLNGGGRLFMSGQEVAYFMDSPNTWPSHTARDFMHNMMGTKYYQWGYDATLSRSITPVTPSDPVFGTNAFDAVTNYYGWNPNGYNNYFPMIVHDTLLGQAFCNYNNNPNWVAGVRTTNGTFKTVYLSPGLEMLASPSVRNQIIGISYAWFNGTLSVQEYDAAMKNISLGQNYPNPGNSSTTIPLTNIDRDMKLQVVDLQGKILREQNVTKGTEKLEVNVEGLEQGMYLYRLTDGTNVTRSKLMQVIR